MFSSVLVANRGEIACRIFRTARAMGLRTIAVYSEADRDAAHVEMADEAICIGGARAQDSYLRAENIIRAGLESGAECIHPGYGFLSENAGFAEACAVAGITFVGPPPGAIRAMGRKDEAKALMRAAGVPVLPGGEVDDKDIGSLARLAEEIGFPVMLKAVAGGGGTGMRRVDASDNFENALIAAQREAEAAFGDARMIIEKCLDRPRHIEVQVLADTKGACVHLFERDCSLQRRHQKIIEEAPAPGMLESLRGDMTAAAIKAARAVDYTGAGTVEFLVEESTITTSTSFYFLEMNTRLQVEHPVSEEITGIDLVAWQFRVAAGEPLDFTQADIKQNGHAIEARIYAEDPDNGFLPSSGLLHCVRWPEGEGVRIETGVRSGDNVSPYYDPMLAKLVVHGASRTDALERLKGALATTVLAGPKTNLAFLHDLTGREDVAGGHVDTGLVSRLPAPPPEEKTDAVVARAGIVELLKEERRQLISRKACFSNDTRSPWNADDNFALSPARGVTMDFLVEGQPLAAEIVWVSGEPGITIPSIGDAGTQSGDGDDTSECETIVAGDSVFVFRNLRQSEVRFHPHAIVSGSNDAVDGEVRAPMHGRIAALAVQPGDKVQAGETLAVLEAMKMEHRVAAPLDGVVREISVSVGEQLGEGAPIAIIDPADSA